MNTKTMRLPPRRVSTPTKRKERDDFHALKLASTTKLLKPAASQFQAGTDKEEATSAEPDSSNQLLAGYLANEYLTKGTLFGQPFDPAQSQAVPPVKVIKREEAEPKKEEEKYLRYVEVANLVKIDGARIAGIVNPTQLGSFLHM